MSLYTVTIEDRIYKVNISGDHCTVKWFHSILRKVTPVTEELAEARV